MSRAPHLRETGPTLEEVAEGLAGPGIDSVTLETTPLTDNREFWDRMRYLMSYTPPTPRPPPPEPELRPGEVAGPTLMELAKARSPGTPYRPRPWGFQLRADQDADDPLGVRRARA